MTQLEKDLSKMEVSTLDELQSLDCESVSYETALEICKRSLKDGIAKHVDLLSLWLQKLLRAYCTKTVCCIEIFKSLIEWYMHLKGELTPENQTACDNYHKLLTDALGFAEWVKGKLCDICEQLKYMTVSFLLNIVSGCLQQSIENNMVELKKHETLAIALHTTVLFLIKDITSNSNKVKARITALLQQLIGITDFLIAKMSHLSTFVKTSKAMANICIRYSSFTDLTKSMPDWMQETILHLCDSVFNIQRIIVKQDVLSVPREMLEEYFKVMQVYLIMLHDLLNCGVKQFDEICLSAIIMLLSGWELEPALKLSNDIADLMSQYVRPYFLQLHELLYQLEDLQNYLVNHLKNDKTNEDYSQLCFDYITVIITDNAEILPQTIQTVQYMFKYLVRDTRYFVNAAHYNQLLEVFGSLLHVVDSDVLYKFFSNGLFQEDLIKSQICADVLMISFRLESENKNWTHKEIMQAKEYYMKCNNSYAILSRNASQWHIQRMLKYFQKMSNPRKLEQLPFNLKNYRNVFCVWDIKEDFDLMQARYLSCRLFKPLYEIEKYYEVVAFMELLANNRSDFLHPITITLKKLLNSNNCKLLANTFYKLASKCTQARKDVEPTQDIIDSCWHVQKFIYTYQRTGNTIPTDMLTILKTLYSTEPIREGPVVRSTQKSTKRNVITLGKLHIDYRKWEYKRPQNHRCGLRSLKRKRSEKSKELILELDQNLKELMHCSDDLDDADRIKLRLIIKNISTFLPS